jgi:hypothetical protein
MDKPDALSPSQDIVGAQWVADRVVAGSLVPTGFAAYTRILHPATLWADDRETDVRWADVAHAAATSMPPDATWETVAGRWRPHGQPGVWDDEPIEGQPPPAHAARLAKRLRQFTTTPDLCRYAVWDGYGALTVPRAGVPRLPLPNRPMLLLTGPLTAATTSLEAPPFDRRANLWWPDDQAWFVATDLESTSTTVGGSLECIAALVADDLLETL